MPPTQAGKSVGNRPVLSSTLRWINCDFWNMLLEDVFHDGFHQILMFCIWKVANMF